MDKHDEEMEILKPAIRSFSLNLLSSRRQFLRLGGVSIIGISALGPVLARGATKPLIIVEQAQGIVVADPMKCVGCGPGRKDEKNLSPSLASEDLALGERPHRDTPPHYRYRAPYTGDRIPSGQQYCPPGTQISGLGHDHFLCLLAPVQPYR